MAIWDADQFELSRDNEDERLEAQAAKIRARKARRREEKRQKRMKLQRRQAILLGQVLLEEVVEDKVLRARVERALDARLEKQTDRKVFGLHPRDTASVPSDAKPTALRREPADWMSSSP